MFDHRILNRVQGAVWSRNPLDRAHGLAVKLWQKENARIQRARTVFIGHHDAAGAAIAFVAPFLGAGQSAIQS